MADTTDGDPYGRLADDYAWLFGDDDLRLGTRTPGARVALRSLPPGSRVLDAACGIGSDAISLVRAGYRVAIADASPAMLRLAERRLAEAGVDSVESLRSRWEDLPAHFPASAFDAVLCTGNSIAHLPDEAAMVSAFESFAAVLAPGGLLVLDTHDWDHVRAAGSRLVIDPELVVRSGRRCLRTYVWHIPSVDADVVTLELGLVFLDDETASVGTHRLDLHPFTRRQLAARLEAAGFREIALDAVPGHDRYTATARRGPPAPPRTAPRSEARRRGDSTRPGGATVHAARGYSDG